MRKRNEMSYFDPLPLREELLEESRRQYARLDRAGLHHVVYRKVWLRDPCASDNSAHPHQGNSPVGMDAFILITPLGARPRTPKLSRGYRREEYDTFCEAADAVSLSTPQIAIERWAQQLLRERVPRAPRKGEARAERNARHRQAHAASGLSANAYAQLHDGEDGLSHHQLRRIVSPRAAQKPTPRRMRST